MPDTSNHYVFCADYSSIASCLFAIADQQSQGLYQNDQALLDSIHLFQDDLLKKLYNRVLRVLGTIEGVIDTSTLTRGDFDDLDFSSMDFQTGYLDSSNSGYSGQFQTILNIFSAFCSRENELSQADINDLAIAFFPVLDAFNALQQYVSAAGFNPCQSNAFNHFNNSETIRLQAAGSDGSGGITEGILLRWLLNGELGDNHIPQGSYANTISQPTGFNRPDDYVYLSKTPYADPLIFTLDFATVPPAISFQDKKWTYIINVSRNGQVFTNIVSVSFKDTASYLSSARQADPQTTPVDFLKRYSGIIEIAVQQKTAFKFGLTFSNNTNTATAIIQTEAMALPDDGTKLEIPVLRDHIELAADSLYREYTGENMRRVRIQKDGQSTLQSFSFETYDDFLKSRPASAWASVGTGFGLSLDDSAVFRQLEEPGRIHIDHSWPQYLDGTTVRVANYHNKWLNPAPEEPSLRESVQDYLQQSQDGDAGIHINLSGADDDPGTFFRYVDLLNLQATDFHLARMLGLGYIDTAAAISGGERFIYQVAYTNKPSLTTGSTNLVYLSLPVGKTDLRLSEKPAMRPLSYQPAGDSGNYSGTYDNQGYNLKSKTRLVNIGRAPLEAEISESDFLSGAPGAAFNHGEHSTPILYGIEYRPATQSHYVLPYITYTGPLGQDYYAWNDSFSGNLPETIPVADNALSLYTHFEKTNGVHYYAIYGIDIFSRASALSDEMATDATVFPPDNQLKPPTDITAQYVQQEDTLIFTSTTEQTWLQGRMAAFPGMDTSFTRLTFNWVDILDVTGLPDPQPDDLAALIKGKQVKTLFKPGQPLQVSGIIRAIGQLSENQVVLQAGGYTLLDNTQVIPAIADEDLARFAGSLLLTTEGQFTVVAANNVPTGQAAGTTLYFTVEKNSVTDRIDDPNDPSAFGTRSYYTAPFKDSRFTVAENLSATGNWKPVQAMIDLVDHSNHQAPVIEEIPDSQGNLTRLWVGGIHGLATVAQARDTEQQVMPGYYMITFDPAVLLAPHPQNTPVYDPGSPGTNAPGTLHAPYVQWYNGKLFLPLQEPGAGKKLLDVVRVIQDNALVLYAYDAGYADAPVRMSAGTGAVDIPVNYHPGYRAYLLAEPAPGNTLNRENILPPAGINDKKSLLALQLRDPGTPSGDFSSAISLPSILFALDIMEPQQPDAPLAGLLKVRPDATRKAAFTFDIRVGPDASGNARTPFGWMFYRANNQQVLNNLYLGSTVATILATLNGLADDPYLADRYLDLLSLQFDTAQAGLFKKYPPGTPDAYGFPVPDLPAVANDPNGNPYPIGSPQVIANYQQAIHVALLPLTEQIPVLAYIKTGKQTDNKLPVIRSIDGNLLDPTDENFDPFPMVRKYTGAMANTTYIRFTDYNLNGSSRFLYFYAAAEVTNRLAIGPLSGFTGPVTILHTIPGEAPSVRSFVTGINTGDSSSPVSVLFNLSPFPAYDTIVNARIFRTTDAAKTEQLGSMDSFLDAEIVVQDDTGITVTDDFSDTSIAPLGETIYYRIAFVRRIINEFELPEDILSLGSEVIAVKLVDLFNPEAPQLDYNPDTGALSWPATANKGNYYLYQQNSRGNWQKIYDVTGNTTNSAMNYIPNPPLIHTDGDGNPIYNRFKIKVENASGLFNLTDKELTV